MANLGLLNLNPGNLKDPATGSFRTFKSPQEGQQALIRDLEWKKSGQSPHIKPGGTLLDLARVWAPASDNNVPENWAKNVARAIGVDTAYAWDKIPTDRLAQGIQAAEGTTALGSQSQGNTSSFAQKIKAKYPQYQDMSDEELTQRVLQKYPQYADMVGGSAPQGSPGIPNAQGYITHVPVAQSSEQGTQGEVPWEVGLGNQLTTRIKQGGEAISNAVSGKINPLSGVLQTAGAVAGGLGDVVNTALGFIPGFKKLEQLIGQGVGDLAKTPIGQAVGKSMTEFAQKHPELADDIGAAFNIATAIPILKGLGAVKNVAMDGASIALKGVAEKSMVKDLTEVAGRTINGRKILNDVPDAIKGIVDNRAVPDIMNVGGKAVYSTEEAHNILSKAIGKIDDAELQPILEQVTARQNFGQSLAELKKLAVKEVEGDAFLREAGAVPQALRQVENKFSGWQHSFGETVDLATENRLKIGAGKFAQWNTPESEAGKAIYRALQKNIEEVAKVNGFTDVAAINAKMQSLIKAQTLLKYINNKAVKNRGLIHDLIQGAATVGGEMAGGSVGVPIAGAIVGNRTAGLLERSLGKLSPRSIRSDVLRRTTPGATKEPFRKSGRKALRGAGATMLNQLNSPQNPSQNFGGL